MILRLSLVYAFVSGTEQKWKGPCLSIHCSRWLNVLLFFQMDIVHSQCLFCASEEWIDDKTYWPRSETHWFGLYRTTAHFSTFTFQWV